MIRFVVPREQEFGIVEFLETDAREIAGRFSVLHYETLAERTSLPGGCYVLAALDQLTAPALAMVAGVEAQLRRAGAATRVLNSASGTLHRLALLDTLRAAGLSQHCAMRASAELGTIAFPVFLREEHHHTGSLSALLRTPEALAEELARSVLRGFRLDELLVVEFVDTADKHGVYRKYAAHRLGDAIVPQFMDSAASWLLKRDASHVTAATLAEEEAYVLANPHEHELRRIFDLAGVGFGRIDYAVKDHRIHTWEINLNPTFGRYAALPPELDQIRAVRRRHFARAFIAAFEVVDVPAPSEEIPIRHDPAVIAGLRDVLRRDASRRAPEVLARMVRPVQPLVNQLVRMLSPLIVRLGRLRRVQG